MAKRCKAPRSRERERMLAAAADVVVPSSADVCVLGGGAAGLVAAIQSAEHGAHTVVLERQVECGRPILATGNGRCNIANALLDASLYNNAGFVGSVCGTRWLDDVHEFFLECGLEWEQEGEGRLYPISRQAASVRDVLLLRARDVGVTLAPAREVSGICGAGNTYEVTYNELFGQDAPRRLGARCVVLATGGTSTSVAEELGLSVRPFEPILCPLACEGPLLRELDGRRVRAKATLVRNGTAIVEELGEVLFREYGLSGIVIFNISRHARPGDRIVLDLVPELSEERMGALTRHTLAGVLDPVIANALVGCAGSKEKAARLAKSLPYRVVGAAQTTQAQVHRGGLETVQFDPKTLESRSAPRVFACGEALDVDGPCGGYNLSWAWKSGMVAGAAAAREALR